MKTRIIGLVGIVVLLLTACNGLPGTSKTGALELEELVLVPTPETVSGSVAFRDEMNTDVTKDWGLKLISGLQKQLLLSQGSNHVRIELLPDPMDAIFVFLNKGKTYKDMVVQAEVEFQLSSDTFFGVICRASEKGWYEFRLNGQGYYEVVKYNQDLRDQGLNAHKNLVEKQYFSSAFKPGKQPNVITLSCIGNQIKVFVNGEQVILDRVPLVIEDNDFEEGVIGFGVAAQGSATNFHVNWVETLNP